MSSAYVTMAELESGLEHIRRSPGDRGELRLIVRRPHVGAREVLEQGELDVVHGLLGDSWGQRRTRGLPDPDTQINIMNARVIALVAQVKERWPLAGDQLYVDLDLSADNLPVGTRLAIGEALVEVTAPPHTGCGKFAERFGVDAVKFVNSPARRALHLRGVNARVVKSGSIRVGDLVEKVGPASNFGASDEAACGTLR
jgi:MOSC domain-containing protein YiiM